MMKIATEVNNDMIEDFFLFYDFFVWKQDTIKFLISDNYKLKTNFGSILLHIKLNTISGRIVVKESYKTRKKEKY